MHRRHVLAAAIVMLGAASCFDPVHQDAVDALGPEKVGVRRGSTHRPGQLCLTCHGGKGPASLVLAIAGTVYSARGVLEPAVGVRVVLEDANRVSRSVTANEVGNFYVSTTTWTPTFPVFVSLHDERADKNSVKEMVSPIGRDGGCASCHYGADGDPTHMPPVFLRLKALP